MGTQAGKMKREATPAPKRPSLARAEIVDKATRGKLEAELDAALKRRPTNEAKLAGALRAVAPLSQALRASMAEALSVMLRRGSFGREIYSASLRALAEAEDRQTTTLLKTALAGDEAGGSAALSAACFSRDPALAGPLAKIAASRQSHLAFGAETARVVRKESNGAHLTALAPMIKESHRIALCVDMFVPLARARVAPVPVLVGPALAVLRGAERHLGRWLVLAEVAVKAGDNGPLDEARSKATVGPSSARAAWSLVAWALAETAASVRSGDAGANGASGNGAPSSGLSAPAGSALGSSLGSSAFGISAPGISAPKGAVAAPQTRPTVELVARLSDRPSADRDTTFLFRMARARALVAKPMLEALARPLPLADEVSIRASLFLARDHGREDLRDALVEAAINPKKDELRGLAVAALWDVGARDASLRDRARTLTDELLASKVIGNVAWGALLRAASLQTSANGSDAAHDASDESLVVSEAPFRWIQWGWLE